MNINYPKTLKNSFIFSLNPKRWVPFFVLDIIFFIILYGIFSTTNIAELTENLTASTSVTTGGFTWFNMFSIVIISAVVGLVNLFLIGAIIYQSYKEKEIEKSFRISYSRYLQLLFAVIVIGFFNVIVGNAFIASFLGGIISGILTIVVALIFFFVKQEVIVNKKDWKDAIMNSYKIFRKDMLQILTFFVVVTVGTFIVVLPFAAPLMIYYMSNILSSATANGGMELSSFILKMLTKSVSPIASILIVILLVGNAIANVFSIKLTTEFYLKIKKRIR